MAKEIRFSKEDIGGELLPILTKGLYRDVLDTLREYIQNGIDAHATKIGIKIDPDQIVIEDNGDGMTEDIARKAIRLGISDKNPIDNVGFRGIGIYSAFNLCDNVEIFTRHKGGDIFNISFNFDKVRREILEEQGRRKNHLVSELYLEGLLGGSVVINTSNDMHFDGYGTKVILSGLLNEDYERLNDWNEVVPYLEKMIPLPFKEEFKFAKDIDKKFKKAEYKTVSLNLQVGNRKEELYRPYTNDLFNHGGKHDVKFFEIKHEKEHYGFAWVCVNDARGVLKDKSMRGLLIRKFGFSISDRNLLEPYFPMPVLYRRVTGEIIIQNKSLIPNAARSDFEYNSTRQTFYQYLPKFIKDVSDWVNKIQEADKAQDTLAKVMLQLKGINDKLVSIRRNKEELLLENNNLQNIENALRPQRKILDKITPEDFKKAESLLEYCKEFITSELTQTVTKRKKLEKKIADSIAKRGIDLSDEEKERIAQQPNTITDLIETFGLLKDDDVKELINYIDKDILKQYLSQKDYESTLEPLRNYLEEKF